MRRQIITIVAVLGSLLCLNVLSAEADTWTQKDDFWGGPRFGAVGFSIGSKGYVGTGDNGGLYYNDFWEYDPSAGTWTQRADFGGGLRSNAVGFSIGSKGYIGTGTDDVGAFKKDFWEYDPFTNTWTQMPDFGGTARQQTGAFSIGNKGYIGMGYDVNYRSRTDFWEYDPSGNAWTGKADFPGTEGNYTIGFSIGSKGYMKAGLYNKDFWEYDPTDNIWTRKVDFGGTGRIGAVAFSIGTKGYMGTGYDFHGAGSYLKDFWEYDPSANTWTGKSDLGGEGRSGAVGFSIGATGYMGTGSGATSLADFWEYGSGLSLSMPRGWNFISLPRTPPDITVGQVLLSVSPNATIVWGYDNTAKTWKKWTPAGGPANTLLTMEPWKGYWVLMNQAATLDFSTWSVPDAAPIALSDGWNLVGYGGLDGRAVADGLSSLGGKWSMLWTWRNNQWYGKHATLSSLPAPIQTLTNFFQGRAYWIKIRTGQATTWTQ